MNIMAVELQRLKLPLVSPFRTSFGTQSTRDVLLVRVVSDAAEGWGECCALRDPVYSSEYIDGAADVLRKYLVPAVAAAPRLDVNLVAPSLAQFKGHRMAKAALETAVLDCMLREDGVSFSRYIGSTRRSVPSGVSVGIFDSIAQLLDAVDTYVTAGYVRIKLKIEPGWDVEPVAAVRERFGDDLLLQVDANTAYTLGDADHLAKLDAFNLLLIEQPLDEEDLLAHAQLAKRMQTAICLDESITSARAAAAAISLRACSIINIKPARVGGYLEAKRIHDVCAANAVPVWCGGMLETGVGRAGNVALAGLPNFTLPGDISASSRFYAEDITEPFVLRDGQIDIPVEPGFGRAPLRAALDEFTTNVESVPIGQVVGKHNSTR